MFEDGMAFIGTLARTYLLSKILAFAEYENRGLGMKINCWRHENCGILYTKINYCHFLHEIAAFWG